MVCSCTPCSQDGASLTRQSPKMTQRSKQSAQRNAGARAEKHRTSKQRAGLFGSQTPKPGARNPSGDTVVQAKPAGTRSDGDKLSGPGYLEDAAEREMQRSRRDSATRSRKSSRTAPSQRKDTN